MVIPNRLVAFKRAIKIGSALCLLSAIIAVLIVKSFNQPTASVRESIIASVERLVLSGGVTAIAWSAANIPLGRETIPSKPSLQGKNITASEAASESKVEKYLLLMLEITAIIASVILHHAQMKKLNKQRLAAVTVATSTPAQTTDHQVAAQGRTAFDRTTEPHASNFDRDTAETIWVDQVAAAGASLPSAERVMQNDTWPGATQNLNLVVGGSQVEDLRESIYGRRARPIRQYKYEIEDGCIFDHDHRI